MANDSDPSRAATRATLLIDSNVPKEAIRILAVALSSHPNDVRCLQLMARAFLVAEERPKNATNALPFAQRAVDLAPNDPWAWRLISGCYSALGQHQKARDAARVARKLNPEGWVNHSHVVNTDVWGRRITNDTMQSLAEMIRIRPQSAETYFTAGRLAQVQHRNRDAITLYERTLAIEPNHYWANYNRAMVYSQMGFYGRAAATFVDALARNTNTEWATAHLHLASYRALRNISVVLFGYLAFACALEWGGASIADSRSFPAAIAVVALGFVISYVLWIRSDSRRTFRKIVRGYPLRKPLAALLFALPTVFLVGFITAAFVPPGFVRFVYLALVVILLGGGSPMLVRTWLHYRRRIRETLNG